MEKIKTNIHGTNGNSYDYYVVSFMIFLLFFAIAYFSVLVLPSTKNELSIYLRSYKSQSPDISFFTTNKNKGDSYSLFSSEDKLNISAQEYFQKEKNDGQN